MYLSGGRDGSEQIVKMVRGVCPCINDGEGRVLEDLELGRSDLCSVQCGCGVWSPVSGS